VDAVTTPEFLGDAGERVPAARAGLAMLGICNGFQIMCEAHLLYRAERFGRQVGGCTVLLKREDLAHTAGRASDRRGAGAVLGWSGGASKVICGSSRPGRRVHATPLEEQPSEKYRHALIAVVSIGVRAGQLGGTDAWLSSHLVSHA
jgi:hypothetical protein